jgi:type IX secretion system PorP/SprF family membrane protein
MRHFKFFTICLSFVSTAIYAQQEAQFTQYNDNQLYYNPAYAGSKELLNVTLLHRSQWVGITGAPMSQSLTAHTPLGNSGFGLGLSFLNDRVGPLNQTWANVDLSYTLNLNQAETAKLAFGMKGGLNLLNADLASLTTTSLDLDGSQVSYRNKALGNVGAGVFFHTKQFFLGFSVPKIIEPTFTPGSVVPFYDRIRHYYASIGGYFNVNRMLKIRPTAMLKIAPDSPFALDGSLAFIFYDKFWLAGTYRLMESAGVYLKYQITDQLKAGYGFDLSVNPLIRHNFGTHEIMLSFDLVGNTDGKMVSPRFF